MRRVAYLSLTALIFSIAFAALVDGIDRLLGGRADGMWFIYCGAYWAGLAGICLIEESASPREGR